MIIIFERGASHLIKEQDIIEMHYDFRNETVEIKKSNETLSFDEVVDVRHSNLALPTEIDLNGSLSDTEKKRRQVFEKAMRTEILERDKIIKMLRNEAFRANEVTSLVDKYIRRLNSKINELVSMRGSLKFLEPLSKILNEFEREIKKERCVE